jgi:hypothetical protein
MTEPRQSYRELVHLQAVYFEDSYVLGIREWNGVIDFLLDLVLTPQHPLYAPPAPGQQHCYRPARLRFPHVTRAEWAQRVIVPARDANGDVDYGNIDKLERRERGYDVAGDWGSVRIESASPELLLLDEYGWGE